MRLRTESREVWLTFDDGSKVLARPIPMSEANRIMQRHTSFENVRGVGQVEKRDFAEINRETYRYKILDWKEMLDEDGNAYPFSRKALEHIIEHDQAFLDQVDQKLDLIMKARTTHEQELDRD